MKIGENMKKLVADGSFVGEREIRYARRKKEKKSKRAWVISFLITLVLVASLILAIGTSNQNANGQSVRAAATHVVINEVYYDAPSGYAEPQCEWIEIYNPTSSDVDISGWMLSDDPVPNGQNEGVWTFPQGTTIPARGYILVVNDATYNGQFNSLFPGITPDFDTNSSNSIPDMTKKGSLNLGNSGDDVHLFDSSQTEVDAIWYGSGGDVGSTNAAPDVSTGHSLARHYDAEDTDNPSTDFYDESSPTPRAQNSQTIPEMNLILIPILSVAAALFVKRRKD